MYVLDESSNWHLQTTTKTYATASSDTPTTISITKEQLTGLAAGTRSVMSATGRKISESKTVNSQTLTTYFDYTSHAQLEKTWGSATYPVSYTYDAYGRMTQMNTYRSGSGWTSSSWPESPGTADTTTWGYHAGSGLLTNKADAAGQAVSYTYATGGKLALRVWARSDGTNALATTYSYNDAGDLTAIDYSDSTPDVAFTYDRLGRQLTASSTVRTHTFTYNTALQVASETVVDASGTNVIDRSYDDLGRSAGFAVAGGGDPGYSVSYGYDDFNRFSSVSSSVSSVVDYSYLPNSSLISGYTMGDFSVTRSFEPNRDLLTQVKNEFDTETISQYDYNNDAAGRRIGVKYSGTAFQPAGPTFYHYGYNTRSEIVSAERYFGTNTNAMEDPVGLQDWSYSYDNIGNPTASARANAISEYAANFLNQYTERTIPGYADVLGTAETNVTVTVNTQAVTRQSYYWHKRLDVDNVATSAYEKLVTTGVYSPGGTNDDIVTSVTGHMFVAESPEAFSYDADGNLLTDGRWSYTWDAENRLIAMQTLPGLCPSVPLLLCHFEYDYMSRRVGKTVYEWNTASNDWQEASASAFLYDGWNLISEQTYEQTNAQTNFFTWGLDLSGSLQGAGGVGGLLSAMLGTNSVCYTFDGNGNVSEVLDIGAGTPSSRILAHYEYSPFGETIVATGDLAKDNPFRFSTKYTDDETTLVYYGYRYYSPGLGRWVSRDPIGEYRQGLQIKALIKNSLGYFNDNWVIEENLYSYCWNNAVLSFDILGALLPNVAPDQGDPTPSGTLISGSYNNCN